DPAVGTAGFLVSAMEHVIRTHTSAEGVIEETEEFEDGTTETNQFYTGDLLEPEQWSFLQTEMFHGFDFDATMLRIAAMNLVMHGAQDPEIHYQDTLSQSFAEHFPEAEKDSFDVVLANPPFKGALDSDTVNPALLRVVKSRKTELLFLAQIERMLKLGGRSATIVPDGVLFGSSNAHVALRKMLIEECELQGVVSMPSGVFKPYAGVSTAVLIFVKGGQTKNVWFYDMQADGYSLDDKRDKIDDNDIPDVIKQWQFRDPNVMIDRKAKAFFIPVQEIKDNKYDLSINRYKEIEYEEVEYEPPKVILQKLRSLEDDIHSDLDSLEGMLG
ncbi:MAG: N-6 DNA methylase, partial [Deltaproteobacteria bacterium]|nr:N-6 DNA methylase [Deltaproteobacteria bacterium]